MKKLGILLLILIIGVGTYVFLKRPQPAPVDSVEPITQDSSVPIVYGVYDEKIEPFIPERLIIQKLHVNALIEDVGLDSEKRMDVPKDDMNVSWYKYGAIPGEMGSAVLAGHFDTKTGGQAVFYRLSELSKGDSIIVTGENGEERTFIVTDTKIFKDATFPIDLVFSKNDGKYLNLITCDGVFDQNEKSYSDRLVVFTILKE